MFKRRMRGRTGTGTGMKAERLARRKEGCARPSSASSAKATVDVLDLLLNHK